MAMAMRRTTTTAAAAAARRGMSTAAAAAVSGFVGAVGNTPLVRLESLSRRTGREILGKAEFMNPGGSIKDRAAVGLVEDGIARGALRPGRGTVVEGTAGNTGIGLAHVARALGLGCVVFMPDTQSREKMDTLRALGAEVFPVPVVPYDDPANFNHQAKRYAEEREDHFYADQFCNTANRAIHERTTGPEIWEQTGGGRLDGFVCATGTGGTLGGVGRYLKERGGADAPQVWLADPPGSVLHNWFSAGVMGERTPGSSITEGIGQGRVTENLEGTPIDRSITVPDEETVEVLFHLLHHEGIPLGASSALNVAAAVRMAEELPPGSRVVTMLCDSAFRYQSRLFNLEWMQGKGLVEAARRGVGEGGPPVERYLSCAGEAKQ
jgi:cysteine synthase